MSDVYREAMIDWKMEMDRRNRELVRMTGHRDELQVHVAKLVAALEEAEGHIEPHQTELLKRIREALAQQSTEKP